ncbi:MAG TPA: tryptophan synthase subunit alpha [Desulfotomaculum sp.]|nr:tryptophan synthase subunit alpha [Desulfotomaculum sp.]
MQNNRITHKFQELANSREKGLITYLTAGDPDLKTSVELVAAMDRAGADLIEIGIPFSDPVADGPSIQQASTRALAKGVRLAAIMEAAAEMRKLTNLPLIFMTYYNPVLQYGLERFVQDAVRAGVDGLIIPDLPYEETQPLQSMADPSGLALIPLVAPTTTDGRLKNISSYARGFIYCVSVTGVTGARQQISTDLEQFITRVRKHTSLPIAIGFGIAGPQQAARVASFCDAVVVGSAIVNTVAAQSTKSSAISSVAGLVKEIKSALKKLKKEIACDEGLC